jgi:hypothetical protein
MRNERVLRRTLWFAAGLLAMLGLVQPVVASTTRATTRAANAPSTTLGGLYYNGYIGVPGAVSAVIVVPKLNCTGTPSAGSAVVVGVGIQSVNSYARLELACTQGVPHYYPSLVVNGTSKSFESDAAQPGDTIQFSVSQSNSQSTDSVIDVTHTFVASANGSGSGTGAGITAGAYPVTGSAVPDFGTLSFSSALINGFPFGSAGKGLQADDLSTAGALQIKTSYSNGDKEAFATAFRHS